MRGFGFAAVLCGAAAASAATDVGYELLFKDALDDAHNVPLKFTGTVPSYVRGTFLQTGPARWTWKHNATFTRKMTHALDGYGKLHKYEFRSDGSVLFSSRFLRTGAWDKSTNISDMAWVVMAQATDPPLPSPGLAGMEKSPNDNNNVNVIDFAGGIQVTSDTATLVQVNPSNLTTEREYNGQKCNADYTCDVLSMKNPLAQVCSGGSAHPFVTDDGDYIGLRETAKVTGILPGKERMAVYRLKSSDPGTVEDLVTIELKKSSYTHSFGLAKGSAGEQVVVAAQPIHYNALKLVSSGTLQKGFEKTSESTKFYVAPLEAGANAVEIDAGENWFFGHFVNSYVQADGKVVADINSQDDIFFDRYSLDVQTNKQARDSWPAQKAAGATKTHGYQTVTRYTIDTAAKTVTSAPLFGVLSKDNIEHELDLFRLHPSDYGREYCGFWAWQSYFNSTSFAAWAVVRVETCGSKPTVAAAWYRENWYPGEASFVPKPGSTDKTEGAMVFKALDGTTGKTSLIVADSNTMETLAEAVLPVHVPFTVHGNWFPAK